MGCNKPHRSKFFSRSNHHTRTYMNQPRRRYMCFATEQCFSISDLRCKSSRLNRNTKGTSLPRGRPLPCCSNQHTFLSTLFSAISKAPFSFKGLFFGREFYGECSQLLGDSIQAQGIFKLRVEHPLHSLQLRRFSFRQPAPEQPNGNSAEDESPETIEKDLQLADCSRLELSAPQMLRCRSA